MKAGIRNVPEQSALAQGYVILDWKNLQVNIEQL